MDRSFSQSPLAFLAWVITAPFFVFFFLLPVGSLLYTGLATAPAETAPVGYVAAISFFTYFQALLSTGLAALVGGAAGFFCFETTSRWRPQVARLSLICFSLPSLVVVLALLGVWGRSGWWNRIVGFSSPLAVDLLGVKAIVLANAFFNFPLFVLSVGLGLRGLDRRFEWTALGLGATRTTTFFSVTLPRLWPHLRTPLLLTFLYSASTSFVVALFLGGGPATTTLEVAIFQALKMDFDPGTASRLAAVAILVSGFLFFLAGHRNGRGEGQESLSEAVTPIFRFRRRGWRLLFGGVVALGLFALVVAPLLSLIVDGFFGMGDLWTEGGLGVALANSLGLAARTVVLVVPLAVLTSWLERHSRSRFFARMWNLLPSLPLAISSLVMGVAFLSYYPETIARWRGNFWPIAAVQALAALPVAHRLVREALFRLPHEYYVIARSFGASPLQVGFRVEGPLMGRAIFMALLVVMGLSLGEVASVLLFSPGETSTLSVEIFRSLQRYRFEAGAAYATTLLLLLVIGLAFTIKRGR